MRWLAASLALAAAAGLADEPRDRLRLAIEDLAATYPQQYTRGPEFLQRLAAATNDAEIAVLQREALLANPLLDFDRLLVLQRRLGNRARQAMGAELGVGTLNSHSNDSLKRDGWDNELAVLSALRGAQALRTLHKPDGGKIVTDLEVDFDGRRVLFASIGAQGNWRLFELDAATGGAPRQLSPDDGADVGHFDACYLPDGRVVFASTAVYQGLPCEFGGRFMACLYLLDPATKQVRQLTFDQDSDWCPVVLPDGRVLYQRWEYSDLPHANSRRLFQMNPDGTDQREFYGSESYFPNSFFYARPMPGHPRQVIGVAGGHHGTPRSGRLLILDPALGRREADGVVQEIPGRGKKVQPIVRDRLVDGVWPQFLMPYPLSEKYVLVSCKPAPDALWGLYLVDVFDNMTLLKEVEGSALLDPIPLQPTPRPPRVPDRIDLAQSNATVLLTDVYRGGGLAGLPRGTVKRLRVVEYYFSYRGTGGLLGSIGMDGPWDIKRVLGTVPVEADGSAHFVIPAQTPVTVQPLDEDGQALQLMRSWFVGQPGERVSCIGCHEMHNRTPAADPSLAARRVPSPIEPGWAAPTRGFNFAREVQPVLDRHCAECHGAEAAAKGGGLDLRGDRMIDDWSSQISGNAGKGRGGKFSASYAALHRFVRRPGIEGDIRMLSPMDYHFSATELGQLLARGHYGVRLDREGRERLAAWTDLNAPFHGTWGEIVGTGTVAKTAERARELRQLYAPSGPLTDYEQIPAAAAYTAPAERGAPEPPPGPPAIAVAAEPGRTNLLDLGGGLVLDVVRVPGGRCNDAMVPPFWIGRCEINNAQLRAFDPAHDSRDESRHGYQFGRRGYDLNGDRLPAVRVSRAQAEAFCTWLSRRSGRRVALPTESQWEWACRAGSSTPFSFGSRDADYTAFANFGDRRLKEFAACTAHQGYESVRVLESPGPYDDWVPRDDRFDDGSFLPAESGRYRPNAWGLYDLHGNVWEWVAGTASGPAVACGGSWYDRPFRGTADARVTYQPYQRVFNVGFRVVVEDDPKVVAR
jgi:hypothetical protein